MNHSTAKYIVRKARNDQKELDQQVEQLEEGLRQLHQAKAQPKPQLPICIEFKPQTANPNFTVQIPVFRKSHQEKDNLSLNCPKETVKNSFEASTGQNHLESMFQAAGPADCIAARIPTSTLPEISNQSSNQFHVSVRPEINSSRAQISGSNSMHSLPFSSHLPSSTTTKYYERIQTQEAA